MAETEDEYEFDVYTCGGMKVWLNEAEIFTFTPFTRNIPEKQTITLSLKSGYNELCVYAEELAERDVFFYFEFRYKGTKPLRGSISLQCEVEEVIETEQFLRSCYFEKDCITEGDVYLYYDASLLKEDKVLSLVGDEETAKLSNVTMGQEITVTASKDENRVKLLPMNQFSVGVHKMNICAKVSKFQIIRVLVLGISPKELLDISHKETIEERKKQALCFVSEFGETVVGRAMAILETTHEMTEVARKCIISSLNMIEKKEDCADFYLSNMLLFMTRYKEYKYLYLCQGTKQIS